MNGLSHKLQHTAKTSHPIQDLGKGRVVNTGIGIGLQNRKCGSDSHLALQRFQWLCGVKEVSPPSQGGDAGALPARAAISMAPWCRS